MPRKKNQVPGQIDLPLTAPEPTTAKNKRDREKTETTTKPKTKELEKKAKSPVKNSEPVKNTKKKEQEVCITTDRYSSQKDFQKKEVHTGAVSGSCENGRGMRRGQCRKADQPVPYSCKYGTGYPYKDAGRKYHHRKRSRCEEKGDCLEGEIRCRK